MTEPDVIIFDCDGRAARRSHEGAPLSAAVSASERDQMLKIDPIARVRAVAAKADLLLVGVGQINQRAQVYVDGFVSREELF
jgi:DNA-binding transcriptional regulator LsrR (DeoR family)